MGQLLGLGADVAVGEKDGYTDPHGAGIKGGAGVAPREALGPRPRDGPRKARVVADYPGVPRRPSALLRPTHERVSRIVTLQHSTPLVRPPTLSFGCRAMSLEWAAWSATQSR